MKKSILLLVAAAVGLAFAADRVVLFEEYVQTG
jgi:hypothetical protein